MQKPPSGGGAQSSTPAAEKPGKPAGNGRETGDKRPEKHALTP
jgi:hypothetical protein